MVDLRIGRILKIDERIKSALEDLRHTVENFNHLPTLALRDGRYRELDKDTVFSTKVDGWEIGYKLEDHGVMMRRKVFLKIPGEKLEEIPDADKDPVVSAVFDVFLDRGQGMPDFKVISYDCILIQQDFIPMIWVENNPNLRVPGGVN